MNPKYPSWLDYQKAVAAVFRTLGCIAEVNKTVIGAHGPQLVDVYVTFLKFGYECCWVVECKLWSSPVPKDAIHTLRSKVQDLGADRGVIFSESGFQSGALAAARNTNILLQHTLVAFQTTAHLHLNRIPLALEESDDPDVPPVFTFPHSYQPYHLLVHEERLFVGNWGKPQAGNVAIVDPATRSIENIIELDKYETPASARNERQILQSPPGNMAYADGKLFVGQTFSEFVLVIDVETQSIIRRIPIPGGAEGAIAASPDGRHIHFASNKVPHAFVIDSATYEFEAVDYPPGSRGCLCVLPHPSEPILYLGIQRGGHLGGTSYPGGNCFLAVYDLTRRRYAANLYLAEVTNERSDDATPICLTYDEELRCLFVGMFQSMRGICRIDELGREVLHEIRFQPNTKNPHFRWVDPLSQALYCDKLLSVNRNNRELVTLDRLSGNIEHSLYLGKAPNGPHSVVTLGHVAIVSYPERQGLIFHDLAERC